MEITAMRLITAIFLLGFLMPGRAQLGQTEDQCTTLYGAPTSAHDPSGKINYRTVLFMSNGQGIVTCFIGGKCRAITFLKIDQSDFSDDEIQSLLNDNSEGHTWAVANSPDGKKIWSRDDGAGADYDLSKHYLSIYDKEMKANMRIVNSLPAQP